MVRVFIILNPNTSWSWNNIYLSWRSCLTTKEKFEGENKCDTTQIKAVEKEIFKKIFSFYVITGGRGPTYAALEREDISNSFIFKLYIMISEILLRIGPIITLAVLNTLIIYKFLRIAKRRHQMKRYSLQPPPSVGLSSSLTGSLAVMPRAEVRWNTGYNL